MGGTSQETDYKALYEELLDEYRQLEEYCSTIENENNDLAWKLAGYEGEYN